jgi:hypothetical protein
MPIGEEFQSDNTEEILHVDNSGSDSWTIIDEEKIIKVAANIAAYGGGWADFKFYINGEEKEHIRVSGGFRYDWPWHDYWWNYNSGTWYYHVKQGDVVEIVASRRLGYYCNGSASVYNLTFRREIVDYVSSDGIILYYYDINSTGEMGRVFQRFEPTVPVSMAVTADGIPIKIVVQE